MHPTCRTCTRLIRATFAVRARFRCDDGCPDGKRKGLVLGVYQGEDNEPILTDAARSFNEKSSGRLVDLMRTSCSSFGRGEGRVFHNVDGEYAAVSVVGLGAPNQGYNELEALHDGMEAARIAAAVGTHLLMEEDGDGSGVGDVAVEDMNFAEGAAEGAVLAMWRYQEFRDKSRWQLIPTVAPYAATTDMDSFQRGVFKAEAQNLVRKWSDTPPNFMTPQHFGQEVINLLCPCGLRVEIHDNEWAENHQFNWLLHVARGSCEPYVVLTVTYCGGPEAQKPIVLLGKGVTYDSGGVCLRSWENPDSGRHQTRGDMSGAASVIAAMYTASALSLPVNIISVVCVCENMLSGMAMKCGDVVVDAFGKSVCVEDTGNNAVLIMSDMLQYACLHLSPRLLIDVGAFSSHVGASLGSAATAVYTNSQTMWSQTRKAGVITGDRVWRMPLWKTFTRKVTERRAHDVNNVGRGHGAPNLAAAFLQESIRCVDWIHFDTANVLLDAHDKCYPYYYKGRMTGRPTRTLIQLLYQLACPEEGAREIK